MKPKDAEDRSQFFGIDSKTFQSQGDVRAGSAEHCDIVSYLESLHTQETSCLPPPPQVTLHSEDGRWAQLNLEFVLRCLTC